jgi:hypothetical protein
MVRATSPARPGQTPGSGRAVGLRRASAQRPTLAGSPTSAPATTVAPPPPTLPTTAVIEGDSVSASLEDRLAVELANRGVSTVKSAVPGCGMVTGSPLDPDGQPYPFGPACSDQVVTRQTHDVATYHPDLVVWISTWEARDRQIDGHRATLGTRDGDREILGLMRQAVQRITARGARVIVVTIPTPYDTAEVTHPRGLIGNMAKMDRLLRRLAADDPRHVGLVDLGPIVCGAGSRTSFGAGDAGCPHVRDGIELRADGLHYGEPGAAWVAPRLADAFLDPDQWRVA